MGKIKIQKEQLEKLVKQKLKDSEIAEIIGVKTISVYFARKRYNINRESFAIAKTITLTRKQKEFIVGCVLGDGNLRVDKNCINPRFSCEHSLKQEEYIKYKYSFIKNLNSFIRKGKRKTPDSRNGILYESMVIRTNANTELLDLYNLFYNNNKKVIKKELLEYYTPFAIAIHYMDDGYLTENGYRIATNCFDNESILNLIDKFKEYNIDCSIHKNNVIYIKANSRIKFTKLIEPFVCKSMKYKLHRI
jgi:hypothetical protein